MSVFIRDYLATLSAGQWWRGDLNGNEYLSPLSDGLWRNTSPEFSVSGVVNGYGIISATMVHEYSIEGDVAGEGSISSDIDEQLLIRISGRVAGVGSISHDFQFREAIIIDGSVAGIGSIGYYINQSKTKASNPILITQNQPYNLGDCPIAAIEYEGFSPNKIVNVIARDDEIYENTLDFHKIEVLTLDRLNNIYPIIHYPYHDTWNDKIKYLVTNYRSQESNGQPLFFQYETLFDVSAPDSGVAITNIYRNDDVIIDPSEYLVQYSYDLLADGNDRYSPTSWGSQQKSRNSHRVRVLLPYKFIDDTQYYTIEYDKSSYGTILYQKELIDLRSLYTPEDYLITESGLSVTNNSRIKGSGSLMLIKDPRYRIAPLDVVAIKGEDGYLSDKIATWKLRMNVGSFIRGSGFFTSVSGNIYNLEDEYFNDTFVPVTNAKPTLVRPDVLKLKESPIYIDPTTYTYPLYNIETYDKSQNSLIDQRGKIAIDINGLTRSDIKIKSIDTQKGYLQLNTNLDPTDEIELTFYMSPSGNFLIDNLELNPKITVDNYSGVSDFHISDYPDGFGIAVRPYTNDSNGWYPYIYDLSEPESSRTLYNIYKKDSPVDSVSVSWIDDSFITICEVDLNKLSTDIVNMTDSRKSGGGLVLNKELRDWFRLNYSGNIKIHESDWYTDHGYYGGTPLSNSSTIIIHVPQEKINTMRQEWIDYYTQEINNVDEARRKGEDEFKHNLDQAIRRHLSSGSDYILIPTTSGTFTGKILDLRQ